MATRSYDSQRSLTGFCSVLFLLAFIVLSMLTPFGGKEFEIGGRSIPGVALILTGVALPIFSGWTRPRSGSRLLCFLGAGIVFGVTALWVAVEVARGEPRIDWAFHGSACLFGTALLARGACRE